jgi:hypothetical protein
MSIKCMSWAWQLDIPAGDKLVLMALADHSTDEGFCWPGVRGIAEKCNLDPRTVNRHTASLVKRGHVIRLERYREDGSQTSNAYHLCIPHAELPGRADSSARGGLTVAPPLEPSLEPSKESPSLFEGAPDPLPDWYRDLHSIEGFQVTYRDAAAWNETNDVAGQHASATAAALRSWWPGPGKGHKIAWATYRSWVQSGQRKGRQNGTSQQPTQSTVDSALDKY